MPSFCTLELGERWSYFLRLCRFALMRFRYLCFDIFLRRFLTSEPIYTSKLENKGRAGAKAPDLMPIDSRTTRHNATWESYRAAASSIWQWARLSELLLDRAKSTPRAARCGPTQ